MNLARAQTRDGGSRQGNQFKMDQNMMAYDGYQQKTRFTVSGNRVHGAGAQNNKYKEEDGFMRGARIAEKIQEFYQTGTNAAQQPNNAQMN